MYLELDCEKLFGSNGVSGVSVVMDLPEHAVAQGGAQCGGAKVTDVPPVKTLFSESDADHHLVIVDVQ